MIIDGWYETETGVAQFQVDGKDLEECLEIAMKLDDDFGDTDMEVTDDEGNDITLELLNLYEALPEQLGDRGNKMMLRASAKQKEEQ
jgi:hypothetical protein